MASLTLEEYVYEPSEDTYLLMDALDKDRERLGECKRGITMEIGSGSGVVSKHLIDLLPHPVLHFATDLNPSAAKATRALADKQANIVEVVQCDLCLPLCRQLEHAVDVLLFNPPYVVTDTDEVEQDVAARSWAGGVEGMEVTTRALNLLPSLLSKEGLAYFVVLEENDPRGIAKVLGPKGIKTTAMLSRRQGDEHLIILRFQW
eukprot:CAMPEP_0113899362 /NCGR_PEP_ID=MMETSP0780_2-20120614/19978_1 /TAXON_ID=652834 /ORGANISM="Palpitomonas bilix" /LENGTH=203 /DNA_ID=CAMNT_0000891499 /DNA_START=222 /DNA_END=830 /DNA_ORIENTATION=+ /assembly_acc=CAM_ASM_000599